MMEKKLNLVLLLTMWSVLMFKYIDGHIRISGRLTSHSRNSTRCIPRSNLKRFGTPEMICDMVCVDGECTIYECVDGVCCTPGSPTSLCCPEDHPVCNPLGCCATEYPIPCPPVCCEMGHLCCVGSCCEAGELCCGGSCCDIGSTCCGGSCCDADKKCCAGIACCESNETCCGDKCCRDSQKCVIDSNGESTCSDKLILECDKSDFSHPCPYQFDAIQCLSNDVLQNKHIISNLLQSQIKCPDLTDIKHLYRTLRSDESCLNGLKPKDPMAKKSPLSFVNCGSVPAYSSQYVSFTSSLKIAELYANNTKSKVIAKVDMNSEIFKFCKFIDLTDPNTLKHHLDNAVNGIFAMKSCEYLLLCSRSIPCDIIN